MGEKERGVEGATEKAVGETGGGGIAIDEEGVQREAGKSTITGVEMFKKHEERGDETKVADAGSAGFAINEPGVQREGGTGGDVDAGGTPEAMASNLNSSRSNVYRTAGPDGGPGDDDDLDEASINNTNSNVKSRIADPAGGEAGIAVSDPGMPADSPSKPKSK